MPSNADYFMQAGQSIGQAFQQGAEQHRRAQPIGEDLQSLLAPYIEGITSGQLTPQQAAAEARNNPKLAALLGGGAGQPPQAQPQDPMAGFNQAPSIPLDGPQPQGSLGAQEQRSLASMGQAPAKAPSPLSAPSAPPLAEAQRPQRRMTVGEYEQMAPLLPTLIAARERANLQRDRGTAAAEKAEADRDLKLTLAQLREKGLGDRQLNQIAVQMAGMDSRERIAFQKGIDALGVANVTADARRDVAETTAGARMGAARIAAEGGVAREQARQEGRAASLAAPKDPAELDIKELTKEINTLVNAQGRVDASGMPADTSENQARLRELRARRDELMSQRPKSQTSAAPQVNLKAQGAQKAKTVKIKFPNGQVRDVPEADVERAIKQYNGKRI